MKRMWILFALVLLVGSFAPSSAGAQTDASGSLSPTPSEGGLALGLGLDYRSIDTYFYFYGFPIAGYTEQTAGLVFLTGELIYDFAISDVLRVGPGLAVGFGFGNAEFTRPGPSTEDLSSNGYNAELLGQLAFGASPQLDLLGRLGIGATGIWHDEAEESAVNLLLGGGVEFRISPVVGLALMGEIALANLSGTSDAGVTSADPGLDSYTNYAIQGRLVFRP